MYEEAATKGRQTLLRYRANHIADYEALHHIHFWALAPEPKHIYYIGQSKNFEEWYDIRKGDQGGIYKEFEEKSTFTKHIYKDSDYDHVSIWKYNENENVKNLVKEVKVLKKLKTQMHKMDDVVGKWIVKLENQMNQMNH